MKKVTKKSEGRTRAASSRASGSRNEPSQKVKREKEALLGRLEELGLLDSGAVEGLTRRIEDLDAGTLGEGLRRSALWDRALVAELDGGNVHGLEGKAEAAHQALVAWQHRVTESEAGEAGLQRSVDALRKVIPFTGATLYLRDPETRRVRPFVSSGFEVDLISRVRFEEGSGFSAWAAARKKSVLYSALHRNEAPRPDQIRSFMAAPVVVGGECVGVLSLAHSAEEAFRPATLRVLILAAGTLAGPVQRHLAQRQIAAREIADELTGLATGDYFRRRLDEEVLRCRELGYSTGLVVFGLPELSEHTARFGADFQRRSLAEVGKTLAEGMAVTEIGGRIAGDRFAVLIPGAGAERVSQRARDLAQMLEKIAFPRRKRMSVSFGAVSYPSDAEEAQGLLNSADKAMSDALSGRHDADHACSLIAA